MSSPDSPSAADLPAAPAGPPPDASRRDLVRLLVLFGFLYFVQGVIEPTANLPYQPLRTQLDRWSYSPGEVGRFFAIIGIAWSLKPFFGLLSDFFPLGGRRRRPYLVLSSLLAAAAFLLLAVTWNDRIAGGRIGEWGLWLLGPSPIAWAGWVIIAGGFGIAMSDVVLDALLVEEGQARGITGQLQSVQWGTMSAASLLTGVLGGYIASYGWLRPMFAGCGALGLVSLAAAALYVREPPRPPGPAGSFWAAIAELTDRRRLWPLLAAAAFLFLWNFNPFYSNVLNHYMEHELHLGDVFYGYTASLSAAAQVVASIAYFNYCRRLSPGLLVHGTIVFGILSILVYGLLHDAASAVVASLVFGFANQTATLTQLDLCARICPRNSTGTTFALLMAVSNTGIAAGINLGGEWYEQLTVRLGSPHAAFDALVLIGAAFTAACWLLVPLLKRSGLQ